MPNTAIFCSGFDKRRGFPPAFAARLHAAIPRRHSLVFIVSTPANHAKNDSYAAVNRQWFAQAGLVFDNVHLIDDRVTPDQALAWLRTASCVLLMGGVTLTQHAFLSSYRLRAGLRGTSAAVMGISAGAINMGRVALCTADGDTPRTVTYEGVGLADVTITPHYVHGGERAMDDLLRISYQQPIYALADDSAIFATAGGCEYLGEIYRIDHGKVTQISR